MNGPEGAGGALDWGAMLRVAATRFGVAPEAFWRLSLKEWRALCGPVAGTQALGRAEFQALAARWPDGEDRG